MSTVPVSNYFIVSEKRGPAPMPVFHESFGDAEREARRLAIAHPADAFVIFRAIKRYSAPAVIVEDIPDPEDIPF